MSLFDYFFCWSFDFIVVVVSVFFYFYFFESCTAQHNTKNVFNRVDGWTDTGTAFVLNYEFDCSLTMSGSQPASRPLMRRITLPRHSAAPSCARIVPKKHSESLVVHRCLAQLSWFGPPPTATRLCWQSGRTSRSVVVQLKNSAPQAVHTPGGSVEEISESRDR